MDKLGQVKKVPPELIIAILVVLVVGAVFIIFASSLHVSEGFCKIKSSLMSIAPTGVKSTIGGLVKCNAIKEKIDGNDWSKCTEEIKKQYDDCSKSGAKSAQTSEGFITQGTTNDETCKLEAQKECAAYQFAKLEERCWYMYGGNNFQGTQPTKLCEKYACFDILVTDTGRQVDFVERSKKYTTILQGDNSDRVWVETSCTRTDGAKMYHVDDYNPPKNPDKPLDGDKADYDGLCLKC